MPVRHQVQEAVADHIVLRRADGHLIQLGDVVLGQDPEGLLRPGHRHGELLLLSGYHAEDIIGLEIPIGVPPLLDQDVLGAALEPPITLDRFQMEGHILADAKPFPGDLDIVIDIIGRRERVFSVCVFCIY